MDNLYWPVYKNLEDEIVTISKLIHISDDQFQLYSIKISELIIRSSVEVESIAKDLYFLNGGLKPNDKELFFDTDCIKLLENKWELSKKKVLVTASSLYLSREENIIITPLKKADKRGTSSCDWLQAYQALKHNRAKNLKKGNFKHLLRAMAGLYILNIYYKEISYSLGSDGTGTNFDTRLGSELFSVKTHINSNISTETDFTKNVDFEECVYIVKPTNDTRAEVQAAIRSVIDESNEKIDANLKGKMLTKSSALPMKNKKTKEDIDKIRVDLITEVARGKSFLIKNASEKLKYEAIINKNQY